LNLIYKQIKKLLLSTPKLAMSHDTKIPEYYQGILTEEEFKDNRIHIQKDDKRAIIMPMSWLDYSYFRKYMNQCHSRDQAETKLKEFSMQALPAGTETPVFTRIQSIYAFLFLSILNKWDYDLENILHFWGDEINFNLNIVHPYQGTSIADPDTLFFLRNFLHCKPLRLAIEVDNKYAKEAIIHFLSQHY
jgi:hypothetical protein